MPVFVFKLTKSYIKFGSFLKNTCTHTISTHKIKKTDTLINEYYTIPYCYIVALIQGWFYLLWVEYRTAVMTLVQ